MGQSKRRTLPKQEDLMARGTLKAKSAKAGTARKTKSRTTTETKRIARPTARRKPQPRQKFTVSHHRETDFAEGLRSYAKYRDLGIAAATDGMVQAHVIRFVPPFEPKEASTPHYHEVEFQMIYVLKGWYKTEFEGEGVHTFEAGSCWIQPPRIKHAVRGYSDDCELLEIVLPAGFGTVELDSL
jgi:quercetin dioxygenase-like cupin family protein